MAKAPRSMPTCAPLRVRFGLKARDPGQTGTIPCFSPRHKLPPQHQQQLAPLLRLIAVERGEGSFELRLN